MKHGRHRVRSRWTSSVLLAGLLLGGGVAGAAESGSHTILFQVESGRSITVSTDVAGDGVAMRQTDVLTGLTSAVTAYVGGSSNDEIAVNRASGSVPPGVDESAIGIYVLASSLTCAACNAAAVPAETAGTVVEGTPGGAVDPVLIASATDTYSPIITGINTGSATAGAALTYTIVTTKAVAGSYSYTLTYVIRAAA